MTETGSADSEMTAHKMCATIRQARQVRAFFMRTKCARQEAGETLLYSGKCCDD